MNKNINGINRNDKSPTQRFEEKRKINYQIKNTLLSIWILLFTIFAFCKCGNDNSQAVNNAPAIQAPPAAPAPIQIDARQLINEYILNEVRANDNYKHHILIVKAIVSDIAETDAETGTQPPMVLCSQHIIQGTLYEIACRFKNRSDINKINMGNTITFEGECKGILNGVIVFTDCELQ